MENLKAELLNGAAEPTPPEHRESPASAAAATLFGDYVSADQLAELLEVTPRTVARWHVERTGPPRTKVGKKVLYSLASVRAWLKDREEEEVRARRRRG
jgi:hypothetical protein